MDISIKVYFNQYDRKVISLNSREDLISNSFLKEIYGEDVYIVEYIFKNKNKILMVLEDKNNLNKISDKELRNINLIIQNSQTNLIDDIENFLFPQEDLSFPKYFFDNNEE